MSDRGSIGLVQPFDLQRSSRPGTKYIGPACCDKMKLTYYKPLRTIIGACPDHPPVYIKGGKIYPLEVIS